MVDGVGGHPVKPVAVLGATGAIGGRIVEIVAGEERAPVRALIHRWWHTGRIARFPIELRGAPTVEALAPPDELAAALDGCDVAISAISATGLDVEAAEALVSGGRRAGLRRLVQIGCLGAAGAAGGAGAAFENGLLTAGSAAGLDVVVVGAPLVLGPFMQAGAHEPQRLVARGRVAVAESGNACHFVYVDDLVEAMWAAAVHDAPLHGRLVATGPAPTTWADFYDEFGSLIDRPGAVVLPDAEVAELAAQAPGVRDELHWPPVPSVGSRLVRKVRRRAGLSTQPGPVRRRLVVPEPAVLAARRSPVDPTLTSAISIGWTPVVDFAEGMRRTAAYLAWAEPG